MTGAHRQSRAVPSWFRMVQPLVWLLLASVALVWLGWVPWWAVVVALVAPTVVGLGCLLWVVGSDARKSRQDRERWHNLESWDQL